MKVEHITYGGNVVVRDTENIYNETVEFFKGFQGGCITAPIQETPFTCKITVSDNIAIFDMNIGRDILTTNFCCFTKEDSEPVQLYARQLASKLQFLGNKILIQPKLDNFFITIVVNPFSALFYTEEMSLAGEIEFYIYDSIRRGLKF
ncbi:MAG: hypothetical protein PHG06_23925 [Parabacteroides sp.]|nr:hypothetical protein [Parabacteroides sp.]